MSSMQLPTRAPDVTPPPPASATLGRQMDRHSLAVIQALADDVWAAGLAPRDCQNAAAVRVLMSIGHELGMSAHVALERIGIFRNRPMMSSDGAWALVLASGQVASWRHDGDQRSSTFTIQRVGRDPETESVTMEQAKARGWTKNAKYRDEPAQMLMHRSRTRLLFKVFADVLAGVHVEDEPSEVAQAPHAQPEPKRPAAQAPPEGVTSTKGGVVATESDVIDDLNESVGQDVAGGAESVQPEAPIAEGGSPEPAGATDGAASAAHGDDANDRPQAVQGDQANDSPAEGQKGEPNDPPKGPPKSSTPGTWKLVGMHTIGDVKALKKAEALKLLQEIEPASGATGCTSATPVAEIREHLKLALAWIGKLGGPGATKFLAQAEHHKARAAEDASDDGGPESPSDGPEPEAGTESSEPADGQEGGSVPASGADREATLLAAVSEIRGTPAEAFRDKLRGWLGNKGVDLATIDDQSFAALLDEVRDLAQRGR